MGGASCTVDTDVHNVLRIRCSYVGKAGLVEEHWSGRHAYKSGDAATLRLDNFYGLR
jgi:hypothetical protein